MKKILLLLIIAAIAIQAQTGKVIQDERFNPDDLNEPAMPFMDGTLIYEVITDINPKNAIYKNGTDSVRIVEKTGWKIQVFSTDDYYLADSIHTKVLTAFENQEVEKIFNTPYYKIRVGNCTTREEAETLLVQAKENDFRDAWIITTKIRVPERVFSY